MIDYKLKPVSITDLQSLQIDIRDKMIAGGKVLDAPRYQTQLPNGAIQEFEHDAASIKDVNTPESEKTLWEQYEHDLQDYNQLVQTRTLNYICYEGVDCEVSQEWKDKMVWLGITLPENPFDLKVKFVLSEIAKTPEDIQNLTLRIFKISAKGVDEQKIKAAERTFRNTKAGQK